MREFPVSNLEKTFVLNGISQNKRLDGRHFHQLRKLDIHFGKEWGSCLVSLGETKVLAQVSCNMVQPKASRPNEGLLFINVEFSPMASPQFEAGRQTDVSVMINRFLDKCFKESKCVDLESLCIVAEEKVWNVRVDINILNYDGNILGCSSVAALAALGHFRHPDVTSTGDQIIIHTQAERDPIPMTILHYPVTLSYAVFNGGEKILVDPTSTEEGVAEAQIILAVNSYREVCGLHLEGAALANHSFMLDLTKMASESAAKLVTRIRDELEADAKLRTEGANIPGFIECINLDTVLSLSLDRQKLHLDSSYLHVLNRTDSLNIGDKDGMTNGDVRVEKIEPGLADLISKRKFEPSGIKNEWVSSSEGSSEEEEEEEAEMVENSDDIMIIDEPEPLKKSKVKQEVVLSGDSEEEDTVQLTNRELSTS